MDMKSKEILVPVGAPAPVGPYSPAVRCGDLLFCSGQIPLDPGTGTLAGTDIQAQTGQVLRNIEALLRSAGLGFQNVVKSTVFMTDLGEFAQMNEVYGQCFAKDPPARSTVQVTALPRGAKVEIEVIAHF